MYLMKLMSDGVEDVAQVDKNHNVRLTSLVGHDFEIVSSLVLFMTLQPLTPPYTSSVWPWYPQ